MYFVAGITGQVGGATARQLLAAGRTVRALVRDPLKAADWSRQGVDVRQGDFNDATAVAEAMEGVEGALLLVPPFVSPAAGFAEARAMVASFAEALRQAAPRRLVLLSSVGSHQPGGLGMITGTRLLEEGLRDLPVPTAFVRPGSFFENYAPSLEAAAASGWLDSYRAPTDRAFPMAATADVGAEIARLLVEGWRGPRMIVELGDPVTHDEIARAMGEVLGRTVRARAVPREQWAAHMAAHGMPPAFIGPYSEMEDAHNAGWIGFGVPGAESVAGATTPAQVFAQAQQAVAR